MEIPDYNKTDDFKYTNTVVIEGRIIEYLYDLEEHFRDCMRTYDKNISLLEFGLLDLEDSIDTYLDKGTFMFLNAPVGSVLPIRIDKTNYEEGKTWIKKKIELDKKIFRSLKINHGKILKAIEENGNLNFNILNYAHDNTIVDIESDGKTIEMHIFSNHSSNLMGNEFKNYANNRIKGIKASLVQIIPDDPVPINAYIEAHDIRKSTLVVNKLKYELRGESYTLHLPSHYIEMLKNIKLYSKIDDLKYMSNMWSADQGDKIIQNLKGIIGYEEGDGRGGNKWREFLIPTENKKEVENAMKNFRFSKSIKEHHLPVLSHMYYETLKTLENCKREFDVHYSAMRIVNELGIELEESKETLTELVGLIAKKTEGKDYICSSYFIPIARRPLIEEILHLNGF